MPVISFARGLQPLDFMQPETGECSSQLTQNDNLLASVTPGLEELVGKKV